MTTMLDRPSTSSVRRRPGTARLWLRSIGAGLTILVLTLVVPLLLLMLTGALPVDPTALSPGALRRPDEGGLLLLAVLAAAWCSWLALALSLGCELVAALRQTPAPRLPGLALPQRWAGGLVSALLLSTGPVVAGPGVAAAAPVDLAVVVQAAEERDRAESTADLDRATGTRRDTRAGGGSAETPSLVTQRHDTLWLLAEQHLGDGQRFVEIAALNEGVVQPDGRSLRPDGRLYPGWTLRMPADADLTAARPDRLVVQAGDTLWQIAEEALGEGARFPEIVTANRGDVQPGGGSLTDPDLIRPGWVLEIPGSAAVPGEASGEADESGSEREAGPSVRDDLDRGAHGGAAGPEPETPEQPDPLDRAAPLPAPAAPTSPPPSPGPTAPSGEKRQAPGPHAGVDGDTASGPATDATPAPEPSPEPSPSDVGGSDESPTATARATEAAGGTAVPSDEPSDDEGFSHLGPSDDEAEDAPEDSEGSSMSLGRGTLLTALLLSGLGIELARRRRLFLRWRRPGERLPSLSAAAADCEARFVSVGARPEPELIRSAVHAATRLSGSTARAVVLEVGPSTVILHVSASSGAPVPAPFHARSEGQWEAASADLGAEAVDEAGDDLGRAWITVGTREGRAVMVDLQGVGTLRLAGDDEVVAPVLRAMAAEVCLDPRMRSATRTLCLRDARIADAAQAGDVIVDPDGGRVSRAAATTLRRHAVSGAARPGSAPLPEAGHATSEEEPWVDPFEVVVSDVRLTVDVTDSSGIGLITSAAAEATWVLAVRDGDAAVLEPLGIPVRPVSLSPTTVEDLVEIFAGAEVPGGSAAAPPRTGGRELDRDRQQQDAEAGELQAGARGPGSGPGDRVPGAQGEGEEPTSETSRGPGPRPGPGPGPESGPAGGPTPPATGPESRVPRPGPPEPRFAPEDHAARPPVTRGGEPEDTPAPVPRLLLLGEVEVEGAAGKAESSRIGRLAETAAFIQLNPGARPSELLAALWPGRSANPQSCRQMISRTRTWLGRTDEGEPYLMPFAETAGRLRLRPEVSSDWADFQRLAAAGFADPADTEHLSAALALVRGRPFGSQWQRELAWADLEVNAMLCAIIDVAHALAERLAEAGRLREARAAVHRALRTEAESEMLDDLLARLDRREAGTRASPAAHAAEVQRPRAPLSPRDSVRP